METLTLNGAVPNFKNNDNWAPIHNAARKNQDSAISTIIAMNTKLKDRQLEEFDINLAGGAQQWTALHLAAHNGNYVIVRELI